MPGREYNSAVRPNPCSEAILDGILSSQTNMFINQLADLIQQIAGLKKGNAELQHKLENAMWRRLPPKSFLIST